MEKSEKDFGLCPVCKSGRIIKMNRDYVCTNRLKPVDTNSSCRFSLPLRSHGVDISDVMVRQLIQTGRTSYICMHDQKGFPYQGCFEIEEGKGYTIRSEKRSINAICPDCGGNIIITRFGYACENSTVVNPTYNFIVPNFICNRYITSQEAEDYCNKEGDFLDGFRNKKGSWFSAFLFKNATGEVELSSIIGVCPVCGGNMLVGPTAFNCSNYKNGCDFKIWRHYYGHKVSLQDMKALLSYGHCNQPFDGYDKHGHIHELVLKFGSHHEIQVASFK